MTSINMESTSFQVPPGVLLPGGCYFELDSVGLPAGPIITHTAQPLCRCIGRQDDILVKYLAMWQSEFAKELQIDNLAATRMAYRLIQDWDIKVPKWLQPIVQEWAELVKNNVGQWECTA